MESATASPSSWENLEKEIQKLEAASLALRNDEQKIEKETHTCRGNLQSLRKKLYQLKPKYNNEGKKVAPTASNTTNEDALKFSELNAKLNRIENRFSKEPSWMLKLSLGSANVTMLYKERFRYKTEYENFKKNAMICMFVLSIFDYLFCENIVWVDSLVNFFVLYYYCTLSLREQILLVNGSSIHSWWLYHHYLSAALAGVLLVWPNRSQDPFVRKACILFYCYLAFVQFLQFRYQMKRLSILRSIGKTSRMDITSESRVHDMRHLWFLLPFIFSGQVFQIFNGVLLMNKAYQTEDFYALGAGILFLITGIGNLRTTLAIVYRKWLQWRGIKNVTNSSQKKVN